MNAKGFRSTDGEWSQRYGAQCPECGVFTTASYKQAPWRDGMKVRYHACPDKKCGARFKSVATDPVAERADPMPEQLRYLPEYPRARCRTAQ